MERIMRYITATELRKNLGRYMEMSNDEDIFVTKNNKVITVLTSPKDWAMDSFLKLQGVFSAENEKTVSDDLEKAILDHAYSR